MQQNLRFPATPRFRLYSHQLLHNSPPFLISTAVGAVIAGVLVYSLQHSGALRSMQSSLS